MAYFREQRSEVRRRPNIHISTLLPMALYRVIGYGTVLDSGPAFDDPPRSARASHLQLADTVLLPATGAGRAARRHLHRLRPVANVHYVADLFDVSGGAHTPTSTTRPKEHSR